MLTYGDQVRAADPAVELAALRAELAAIAALPGGILRHGRLVGALMTAGMLAQGLADYETARFGNDGDGPLERAAMHLTVRLACAVLASWDDGFAAARLPAIPTTDTLPAEVALRLPEGYAYYAVYPEAYAVAARLLPGGRGARVIGLRSIGTSLAAIAAAALGGARPVTLRPVGHPFRRRLVVAPGLAARLAQPDDALRVIVDEGPGLSGSSFGATADWLEAGGVPSPRIACLPSHAGWPGAMVTPAHTQRWARMARPVVGFEGLILNPPRPEQRLQHWFDDLIGPSTAPPEDVSGGGWRGARDLDAPADPFRERRKYLLRTDAGVFLAKFAGLGVIGQAKLARARTLAGWIPEVLGLRHGFLLERWHADATPAAPTPAVLERIGAYLGHRAARALPCSAGDDLATLAHMARHNTAEALGEAAAAALRFTPDLTTRPSAIDGRLHAWEWLCLPDGRLLKADALDHDAAHDLIGAQDLAWDVAGATVEFDLDPEAAARLRRNVAHHAGRPIDPRLVADHLIHYSAFQLGLWTGVAGASRLRERYRTRIMG